MSESDLEKEARQKLAQARALIKEAGDLAKQGQFLLHFGEIGTFIPRSLMDRAAVREKARAEAIAEGRTDRDEEVDWSAPLLPDGTRPIIKPRISTPWDDLDEEEREELVETIFEEMWSDSPVPYEFLTYADADDADRWWHPSRC